MQILVAPDSFKGSMMSTQAADAIEKGILSVCSDATVIKLPMGDGGEGTAAALLSCVQGTPIMLETYDPLGRIISAQIGVTNDNRAIIEMAASSGLMLLSKDEQNPMHASTAGLGVLIKKALDMQCNDIYICIGGSATCDGGTGMLAELGVKFYSGDTLIEHPNGEAMEKITFFDTKEIDKRLFNTKITVMCDVDNPFFGQKGASYVFSPQKGASADEVKRLDNGLKNLAGLIKDLMGIDLQQLPGSGAAGGMGGALSAFCGGKLKSGIDFMCDALCIDKYLPNTDLVITGEGKTDLQTLNGKVPFGIAKRALRYNVPVICISGSVADAPDELYSAGIKAVFSVCNAPMALESSIKNAEKLLEKAASNIIRLLN